MNPTMLATAPQPKTPTRSTTRSTTRTTRTARPTARVGVGRAFGTFGELIQGELGPDGKDFLVTLPIARWSVAVFRSEPGTPLRSLPAGKGKSCALVRLMAERYGLDCGGTLALSSELPVGKGMASSSADLVATARAIGSAFGLDPTPAEIEDLLREIEPTDGVMYDEVVAFHHREVRLRAALGPLPSMTIVGIDEGGAVDTVQFNRIPKHFSPDDMHEYAAMLQHVSVAMGRGDLATLGAMATRSAEMNQRLRPKYLLGPAVDLCRNAGALGVVVAHSGTRLGVLLADADPDFALKRARVLAGCQAFGRPLSIEHTLSLPATSLVAA